MQFSGVGYKVEGELAPI